MRIMVTGGRTYHDAQRVREALGNIHRATPIEALIHGGASGADTLAQKWACDHDVERVEYSADWGNIDTPGALIRRHTGGTGFYNAKAGYQRNVQMLVEGDPDLVVVFPGGNGTAHARTQALRRGIAILDVEA